jgi:translation initiation factor IF-2
MRVYEIAKQKNLSSKEILDLLKNGGFELSSHMSVIPDDGIAYINKALVVGKAVGQKSEKPALAEASAAVVGEKAELKKEAKPSVSVKKEEPEVVVEKDVEIEIGAADKELEPVQKKEIPKSYLELEKEEEEAGRINKIYARRFGGEGGDGRPRRRRRGQRSPRMEPVVPVKKVITEIAVNKSMPLFEAADLMGKPSGDLILSLLKKGMVCNINHILSPETIIMLAEQFGIQAGLKKESVLAPEESLAIKKSEHGDVRWPIIVVMGHVDHGKTTLLDFIRKMSVAAHEKGGITQHIGAYEVDSRHGKIVFLDTPGHEAFSYLRSKGARVTDIVILVVAADDGVMPQTVEAIKLAKEAEVPIIVAINKVDKVGAASIQTVKRQLAENGLVVEDWGGEIICVPISAKTGQGVEDLLEMVVLQSQMMDLKSNPKAVGKAFVLESKVEKGFGPVATAICVEGVIKQGDFFVCGACTGRVRLLINSYGEKIAQTIPSVPVKIVGFDSFAEIGDSLNVVSYEEYNKTKSIPKVIRPVGSANMPATSLKDLRDKKRQDVINLIIRTDTLGSKEAIEGLIERLVKKAKKGAPILNVLSIDFGDISEGDIDFAESTESMILGLHIKTEKNAALLAKDKNITIKNYDVIYHLIEFLEEILSKKRVEKVLTRVGIAQVLKVFDIKKIGIVAGCSVKEGVISRDNRVVCLRRGQKVGEGKIVSLQREGKSVKEVHAGYEFGFVCDNFSEWKEGDTIEFFSMVEKVVD